MSKKQKKILIVDDDTYICNLLHDYLERKGYDAEVAFKGKEALKKITEAKYDLVLTDYRLPDLDGMEILDQVKKRYENVPVVVMTAYAEIQTAVKVIKSGAFDYVVKPVHQEEILKILSKALKKSNRGETRQTFNKRFIAGKSKKIKEVLNHVKVVGPTDISVLIQGETGSGKEFISRAIHFASERKDKTFIAVDCGAIPKDLANSELFGHIKGSFTGAVKDKIGYFEQANGGTLFLDEVGNLPYENQVKLLRALQERVISRVGSNKKITVDVRIIAAASEKLLKEVEKNNFREDLYHRINGFKIELPALRERREDIPEFARSFIRNANEEFNKHVEGLDERVQEIFMKYPWYGNIRELENVINRCVLLADGPLIQIKSLPDEIQKYVMADQKESLSRNSSKSAYELKEATLEAEKEAIINALITTNFNKSKAARLLKVDRKTLYNKIREYDISMIKK